LIPGTHIAVISKDSFAALQERFKGYELRDTFLILTPGPTNLFGYLFRVPLEEKTVAAQVLKTGTGGLNIDKCRIRTSERLTGGAGKLWSHYRDGTEDRAFPQTNDRKGRWPSNLLLIHHPECIQQGINIMRPKEGYRPNPVSKQADGLIKFNEKKVGYQKISYTSHDGTEIISNWICHPSCPVKLLDTQSGVLDSGPFHRVVRSKPYSGYHGGDGVTGKSEIIYGDIGGASRFYPQFKNLAECLDWIDRLINSV
jgi:hypothetical protein